MQQSKQNKTLIAIGTAAVFTLGTDNVLGQSFLPKPKAPVPVTQELFKDSLQATTLDGTFRALDLLSLDSEQATFQCDAGEKTVNLGELLKLEFSTQPQSFHQHSHSLLLNDGSIILCDQVQFDKDQLALSLFREIKNDQLILSTAEVLACKLEHLDSNLIEKWEQLVQNTKRISDMLVILDEETNQLRKLEVVIKNINQDNVVFTIDNEIYNISLKKKSNPLVGILFFEKPTNNSNKELIAAVKTEQSLYNAAKISLSEGTLNLVTQSGLELELNYKDIHEIDFSSGKILDASSFDVLNVQTGIGMEQDTPVRKRLPHFDRSLSGGPITIGDQFYAKGLSLQAGTEFSFRIPENFKRLRGKLALDPENKADSSVKVLIYINGIEQKSIIKEVNISKKSEIVDLDLNVSHARKVTLIVSKADNGFFGDHLNIANLRITK